MGQAKNKKQRECPAKGGIITPEECGQGRNSTISCPLDCVHNSFAPTNHEGQFAALETRVFEILSRKLGTDLTPSQIREIADAMGKDDMFTSHALHIWRIHGEGRLARWKIGGFLRGWKNDDLVLISCLETIRPALFEFRGMIDGRSCHAVDLLCPELPPFVLVDVSTASHVGRYDVMLGWRYSTPAGQRCSGGMIRMPRIATKDPVAAFQSLLDHLGAPTGNSTAWLLEHMPLLADAFIAITAGRREKQIAATDLRQFSLRHRVEDPAREPLLAELCNHPRLFLDAPREGEPFVTAGVLDESINRDRDEVAEVVGNLRLHPDTLEINAIGETNLGQARRFIASLATTLGSEECVITDFSKNLEKFPYDRDLIPPEFFDDIAGLEVTTRVLLQSPPAREHQLMMLSCRDFPDRPIPALDGKSPREAAVEPALRPLLIQLMKDQISFWDAERRRHGADIDANPLLKELGLDELILPPPPIGYVEEEDYDDDIPLDPPPHQELLDGEELENRLDRVIADEALWNRLDIRLADILDAFNDLSDKLNPNELETLQSTVLSALGALHPDQPPGYDPSPERMLARYESWMISGDEPESVGAYIERIFAETRQPELCEAAADLLIHIGEESGKKLRPKKLDGLFTAIAAAVWEAAHWPPVLK